MFPKDQASNNQSKILYDIQCEYSKNPIGLDVLYPRFSWKVNGQRRGEYQTAYQILVSSTVENLDMNLGDMWDSGKVESSQSVNVCYNGKSLQSENDYYFKVRIWDNSGQPTPFGEICKFGMGLLEPGEWKAKWIAPPAYSDIAPMFRKEFNISKDVVRARAYISGLGYYILSINGKRVGNHVLDPAWTDYGKRILYATYDVTTFLQNGKNVVGIILGGGWFMNSFFKAPQLIFQLKLWYKDGTTQVIASSNKDGWKVSYDGPIRTNSIYIGEVYDARLEKNGWDCPGFDIGRENSGQWFAPLIAESPGGKMVSQNIEPIKVIEEIQPIELREPKPGVYVYDIGQNISGWVKLSVQGKVGTQVKMKFAEILYNDGTVNMENLRSAQQCDVYILKGSGLETFTPNFTYHGFRYVQVEGFPGKPGIENVTAQVVRSSVEQIGTFQCSNELINRIQYICLWTESNNLHGLPTDCPQRDERLGWLNDVTVRAEAAIYNYRLARLYTKWMDDIADAQGDETGAITDTAPFYLFGRQPADPICSSYLVVPWLLYLHYSDKRILEKHYNGMKRWVAYLEGQAEDYIVSYSYYGDWASPVSNSIKGSNGCGAVSAITPGDLMSTGYFYFNASLMAKIARVLNKFEDERYFIKLANHIKEAFNKKFFDKERYQYAKGSQGSNTLALYMGLVDEAYKQSVLDNLVKDIVEAHNTHLTTGNQCTKYIFDVLTEAGQLEIAYALATQTTYPSWGYMIEHGATTTWERWEYVDSGPQLGMASHNHPMNSTISAWFYKYIAGIRVSEDTPGFEKSIIRPYLPKGLQSANAELNTIRGPIKSCWSKKADEVILNVHIPFNSWADVYVPIPDGSNLRCITIYEGERLMWDGKSFTRDIPQEVCILDYNLEQNQVIFKVSSGSYCFKCKAI